MQFIIIVAVIGACSGFPYTLPRSIENEEESIKTDILGLYTYPVKRSDSVENSLYDIKCPPYQVPNIDGSCSIPDITQNVFIYGSPIEESKELPLPKIPKPKIEYNVVVIRSKDSDKDKEPIIIPPPREKTVVLVLKKENDKTRKVIEVESDNPKPEVFFVDYKDGENFNLPGGVDLQTALQYLASENSKESSTEEPDLVNDTYEPKPIYAQIEEQPKSRDDYVPPSILSHAAERTSKDRAKRRNTKITRGYPLPRQRYSEPGPQEPKTVTASDETYASPSTTTIRQNYFRPSIKIGAISNKTSDLKQRTYTDEPQISYKSLLGNKFKSAKVSAHYRLPILLSSN